MLKRGSSNTEKKSEERSDVALNLPKNDVELSPYDMQEDDEEIEKTVKTLLSGLERDERSEALSILKRSFTIQHKGPIPHPKTLAGYENVLPGAADRIIAMAERSLQCEITCKVEESKNNGIVTNNYFPLKRLGLFLGFGSLIALLLFVSYLLTIGKDAVAVGTLTVSIGALVGLFIKTQRDGKKQEEASNSDNNQDE